MDPQTDVDELLRALGKWGRFQKFQIGLILIGTWPLTFQLLSVVFTGYRPDYRCSDPFIGAYGNNLTKSYSIKQCEITLVSNVTNSTIITKQKCPAGHTYSLPKDRTFVTEWDLVCEKSALAELSQTLIMAGQALGAAVCTSFADRYGRKTVNVISHISLFLAGIGLAFVPTYTGFAVLRFFIGVMQQGMAMSNAVLALEILPKESRYLVEVGGLLAWSIGVALLTPFGYFLQNYSWRYTQLAVTLFSAYSLIQYWILDESIRWLLINSKTKEAERIVKKACKWNNVSYRDVLEQVAKKAEMIPMVPDKEKNGSLIPTPPADGNGTSSSATKDLVSKTESYEVEHLDARYIFKERRILLNSLILWFAWATASSTYYALTLTSTSLAGDRFLNFLMSGIVEIPAAITEFFCLNRIGRKKTCIMFFLIAGVSLVSSTIFNKFSTTVASLMTASVVFTFVGKWAITGAFSTIFLYTPELYPTNLRNVGMGFSSASARVGSMVSPFAATLAAVVSWGPSAICGAMCMIVVFLTLYLPETKGYELPQTLQELRLWYRDHEGRKKKTEERK